MNKLEKYLTHKGISQRFFAKKIGTTPNNLNLLVKGKSTPTLRLAYQIEKNTGGLVNLYDWLPPESFDITDTEDQKETVSEPDRSIEKRIKRKFFAF